MPTDKYQVRCQLNGTETVLGRHRTSSQCKRRYLFMKKILAEVFRDWPGLLWVWSQDPQGLMLEQTIRGAISPFGTSEEYSDPPDPSQTGPPGVKVEVLEGQTAARWAALFERMNKLGVTSADLVYDGYGDSGQTEDITFFSGEKEVKFDKTADDDLDSEMDYLCDSVIPSGYENNDGGYGTVTVDVASRTVTLEHNDRFTNSEYSETRFELPEVIPDLKDEEDQ